MQLSAQLQRLAFVQEWSDAFIQHLLDLADKKELNEEEAMHLAQSVASRINLDTLRGRATVLLEEAASLLEFSSTQELYELANKPPLSVAMKALPARQKSGQVVAISMTEVVFKSNSLLDGGNRLFAFEKARGGMDVQLNDFVAVNRYGNRLVPDSLSGQCDESSLHSAR